MPMTFGSRRFAVPVACVGAICLLLFLLGLPLIDTVELVGLAAGAAALVALVTFLAWRSLDSVRGLLVLSVLAPIAATVVGAATVSWMMFLSNHDLKALLIVLLVSGGVGLATAVTLADRVAAGIGAVAELARAVDGGAVRLDCTGLPEELQAVADELEEVSRRLVEGAERETSMQLSRRHLVAWVSHDLRPPLAEIRAMSSALDDGMVDAETAARYHRAIRQEADRLAGLVDDLFELSRISSGLLAAEPERVPLADLVGAAVAGASAAAAAKGVVLERRSADPSPLVELSTPEMARVVRSLLDNAIRHTPAGGRVEIVAGLDGPRAVVVVVDACGGTVVDHDLDLVFDLAYRDEVAHPVSGDRPRFGLAIAKGLVEAQHGTIAVANVDAGCRFTVSLPLADGAAVA